MTGTHKPDFPQSSVHGWYGIGPLKNRQGAWLLGCLCSLVILASLRAEETRRCPSFVLTDQFEKSHTLSFPATNLIILTIADKEGHAQVDEWVTAMRKENSKAVPILGIADVRGVPNFWRGFVRKRFQKLRAHSVLLDWNGVVTTPLQPENDKANLYLIAQDGTVLHQTSGAATAEKLKPFLNALATSAQRSPSP